MSKFIYLILLEESMKIICLVNLFPFIVQTLGRYFHSGDSCILVI